jgi:hypothetical protein
MDFCVVLYFVCFVSFSVLFVCTRICVLYDCHRMATQLQLNILYNIISYIYIYISYFCSYSMPSWRGQRQMYLLRGGKFDTAHLFNYNKLSY